MSNSKNFLSTTQGIPKYFKKASFFHVSSSLKDILNKHTTSTFSIRVRISQNSIFCSNLLLENDISLNNKNSLYNSIFNGFKLFRGSKIKNVISVFKNKNTYHHHHHRNHYHQRFHKQHQTFNNLYGLFLITPFRNTFTLSASSHHNNDSSSSSSLSLMNHEDFKKTESQEIIKSTNFIKRLIDFISDYIIEPILITFRFIYLLGLFFPLIIGLPLIFVGKRMPEYYNERRGTLYWYDMLVRRMEIAGPTFIKLAQWAASRTDIFPQEMCLRFSKLHSAVDPHPFKFTKKTIENFFNKPFEQVFSEFDQIPIGVGAIAQVFILFFTKGSNNNDDSDDDDNNLL